MRKRARKASPEAVSQLLSQIAEWRTNKTKPGRMPEALWSEATRLGRDYGVSLVSRQLKLDYHGLKRRVLEISETAQKQDNGFVELRRVDSLSDVSLGGAFVTEIEISRSGDTTMRVRQSGPSGIALSEIVESFLMRN